MIIRCGRTVGAVLLAFAIMVTPVMAKTPIVMWLSGQPVGVTDWAAEFEEQFNKANPDIDLSVELYSNVTEQREKVVLSVAAGVGPDIVYEAANVMPQWVSSRVALPVDNYLDTWSVKRDIIPDILHSLQFDGQTWGVPFSVWSIGDLYNMNVMAGAGVAPPKTWDEMVKVAKHLSKIGPDGQGEVAGYSMSFGKLAISMDMQLTMEQLGSTVIDVDGREAKLNTVEARQALTYLRDLAQAGMPPGAQTSVEWLLADRIGVYHLFRGYNLVDLADTISSGSHDLTYSRFVGPSADSDAVMGNAGVLMITATSPHPDAAWRVVQAFMDRKNLKDYIIAHGACSPSRLSMHGDNDLQSLPWAKERMAVLTPPIYATGARHPYYTDYRKPAATQLQRAILGEVSINEALLQAENIINQIVQEKMDSDI